MSNRVAAAGRTRTDPGDPWVDPGGASASPKACFAGATRLATEDGEIPVDCLRVGDRVLTRRGGTVPITFLGHRGVDCRRHPRPAEVWPVRVRAGAFGSGRPRHDLVLSPNLAVHIHGVLVPVRCLIDNVLIVQESVGMITWWHVALPAHDIVLAEGMPTECFPDTGEARAFDNGGSVLQLHPDFWSVAWEAERCAPLVVTGPRITAIRRALRPRAARWRDRHWRSTMDEPG